MMKIKFFTACAFSHPHFTHGFVFFEKSLNMYRAKFLKGSAEKVQSLGGEKWLYDLRAGQKGWAEATKRELADVLSEKQAAGVEGDEKQSKGKRKAPSSSFSSSSAKNSAKSSFSCERLWANEQLQLLPGVGRKVADCVCVFSLDHADSIPVDTHVWDIAVRDYCPSLKSYKSLTPKVYEEVGDIFRIKFGAKAGWAHSVLFAAELPLFRASLPLAMQDEMKQFADLQRQQKKEKKEEKGGSKKEKLQMQNGGGKATGKEDEDTEEEKDELYLKSTGAKADKKSSKGSKKQKIDVQASNNESEVGKVGTKKKRIQKIDDASAKRLKEA